MIMNLNIVTILFFICQSINAKDFCKVTIMMNNNEVKEGYIKFPINATQKKISFKTLNSSSIEHLSSDGIKYFEVVTQAGNFTLLWTSIRLLKENGKSKINGTGWTMFLNSCKDIELLQTAHAYDINRKGELIWKVEAVGRHVATSYFLLRRTGEDLPTVVDEDNYGAKMIGEGAMFIKKARIYFKDEPMMLSKINEKVFDDVHQLFDYYCGL